MNRRSLLLHRSDEAGAIAINTSPAKVAEAQTAEARPTFRRPTVIVPVPTPQEKFQQAQPGVPDTQLTREATGLLHEFSTELLFNHSHRVFFWADELGRQTGQNYDQELLFSSVLHFTTWDF